ncbi:MULTISPECIES: hypothetical protein, partial [Microbacterium]|uniref:hypothetical protein n=1 Tax=Microbacterium TaxID=33882 RepID=UPI001C9C53FD
RNPIRDKPPDQRPIFQGDHAPNLVWVAYFSTVVLAGFSSVVDKRYAATSYPSPPEPCPNDQCLTDSLR